MILLFTDGEEVGSLGARAFVNEHPWARDVRLALNFEARGSWGPAVMFESSTRNAELIAALAEAPYPVAYSFLSTIYAQMPNGTDLTVVKELPTQVLNFGYLFDWPAYHSARDSVDTIDPCSLQHHGSYMLALTQRYGNQPLVSASAGDAIFFTLWPGVLVQYSAAWAFPLAVALALLFGTVLVLGLRRGHLTARGVVGSTVAFLLRVGLSLVIVTIEWGASSS